MAGSNFRLYGTRLHGTVLSVKANSLRAVKRAEARQRMADLRRARRSPRAALAVQRQSSLFGDAAKWRLTNLAQVLRAMS
jgi:hypothetical protein